MPVEETKRHSRTDLIRAGFWLSVGALIVFPVVMVLLAVVGLFLAGFVGSF